MSVWQIGPGALLAWAYLGFAMGLVIGRRSHDPVAWLAISAVNGPLAMALVRRG